jgi:hypothetical protein
VPATKKPRTSSRVKRKVAPLTGRPSKPGVKPAPAPAVEGLLDGVRGSLKDLQDKVNGVLGRGSVPQSPRGEAPSDVTQLLDFLFRP